MLSFLASSTFFKYAQNEGFAFKKFMGGHAPKPPSIFRPQAVLTGNTWHPTFTPGLPDF